MASIPLDDAKAFELWVRDRWLEKDVLLEQYVQTGRFPADDGQDKDDGRHTGELARGAGYIETEVKLKNPLEYLLIFAPEAALAMLVNLFFKFTGFLGHIVAGGK